MVRIVLRIVSVVGYGQWELSDLIDDLKNVHQSYSFKYYDESSILMDSTMKKS